MIEYQTNPMPCGPHHRKLAALHRKLRGDARYQKAKSCRHCADTADSFNRYVSTYCHVRQENIADIGEDLLDRCMTCELYERRAHEN